MRKIGLLALFALISFQAYPQCAYTGTPLTQVGSTYTFCVDNQTTFTTGTVNAGQFVLIDVVKGFDYTFSVGNVFTGGRNENLTILNAATNASVSPVATASGASGATLNWTASISGQIKLLLSHSACTNDNRTGGALTLTLTDIGNTQDSETAFGTDQWVGHVYNWTGTAPPGGTSPSSPTASYPFTTANYVGYYPVTTETLSEGFGGDLSCIPIYSNGVVRTNMYSETFAVRYRMRSTKVGCYEASFNGDDGIRIYVDGVKVFDEWKEQSPTAYDNVLLYLNGNSEIIFDYYENAVNNVASFSLTPFDPASNTVTATATTVCSGVAPTLDGSAYTYNGTTVNPSISFQWQSSTDNVTFTNISGANAEDYTPPAITTTTGNVVRYYRRIVTASAATAAGCTYTSNTVTIVTSQGIAAVPGTISGTATQCAALTGQSYSVASVANATSYNWTVPTGWTITAGAGTNTITVTTGAAGQNGNITVASVNGCGSSATRTLAVTAITSVAGSVSANQTICSGTAPANITLTGSTGSIQWQSSPDNTTFTNISGATAATLTSAQMETISATTYYRAVVTNGACASLNSASVTVTTNPVSVAGTVSVDQSICTGTQPANITLTGNTGTVQWQSSTNNTTFTNIAGATAATLTSAQMGTLTATRYYRAIVSSGVCTSVNSASVTVAVSPTSVAGTVSANQTICSGTQPGNITLTGSTGSIQWQSSPNNTTFTNISGANTATLTSAQMGAITATTYYRAVVTSGGCTSVNSASVTVTTNAVSVAGTVSANQSICTGTQPANITLTGNTGTIQWQSSPDNTTFTNISGATAATLTSGQMGTLSATRYYRAVVTSGVCTAANSSAVTVTVSPTSVAGTVSANQTICSGSQPGNITLTGNTGSIQWQSSPNNTTFTNISGATAATLTSAQMGTITATTYYRAVVTNGGCASVNSASVTVTTNAVSVAGTVSANQSICTGTQPANITLTGNTGTIQWQSSPDNTTFTNISGATAATLTSAQMGTLSATRYYRAVVTSGVCTAANSSAVTVTVSPTSVAGTVSANQTICSGTQPGNITLTGSTGSIQWQSSPNNTTFTNISGATATTLTSTQMGTVSATTYYRAVVSSSPCASVNSASVTVTTNTLSVAGTVSANQTICSGTAPANITLTGSTGSIQWQSSPDNTTFTNIPGATAATLTSAQMGTISATTYYRAVVTNGACASVNSASVTVTANPVSVAGTVSTNQSICTGTQPANITLAGNTGTIQWQSSPDNTTFTNISGATAATLASAQMGTLSATRYYRALVTSGVCTSVNSASVTVTVSPTSVAGTVSANQTICSGTQPGNITLTGSTGAIQWQSSPNNTTFTNISGATAATLTSAQMGTIAGTTYYRAVVTSGGCTSVNSASVTVTTNAVSVAGTVSANQSICTGTQPANITLTGNTGTIQWQSSPDNTTFTNISGATAATLTSAQMGTLSATRYYRAVVTSGVCTAANSSAVTVTVSPTSVAGTVSANQTICSGSQPGNITLTGSTGAIQWQSSPNNTTFTNISGATAATLTSAQMGTITATTYYRAVVTNGGCASAISPVVTISIGTTTTWNGTNWSNGTPVSTSAVVFTANYTSSASLDACTINVTNNASVVISSGNNVTINGALTVDTGSRFTLKSNANLLQNTNAVNSGAITVERTTAPLMRQDYVMWSSPVDAQNLQSFSPETLTNRFYTYNPDTNLYAAVASPSTTNFETGKGYLIRMPNNHPATPTTWSGAFTGNPHNGDFNVAVTSGGYNAIGNPYPSSIDADAFIAANSLTEALYFWRKTNNTVTTSYATYTLAGGTSNSGSDPLGLIPNGIIQPCQGFIVKATSPSISFTNAIRSGSSNAPFLRLTENRSRIWLNLTTAEGFFGQTLVAYMPGATAGVDPAIDGRFFNDSPTAITSIIDNQEYAIQGRGDFTPADVVPLGFKSQLGGTYTIAINNVDGLFADSSQTIYLNDNLNNTFHNLSASPYVFATEAGVFNSRFELRYQNLLSTTQPHLTQNAVVVYKQGQEAVVDAGSVVIKSVEVYDISGRLLALHPDLNNTQVRFHLPTTKEVLLVKVISKEQETLTKKLVN